MLMLIAMLTTAAMAQDSVPDRRVPAPVLNEVRLLETRFDAALAADCDPSRCFPKGCTYVDHAVADRPRSGSLPGLGQDPAPDPQGAQAYLTAASCAFAYEDNVGARDAAAISRRLQSKLSGGWTVVTVTAQRLSPLPDELRAPYVPPTTRTRPTPTPPTRTSRSRTRPPSRPWTWPPPVNSSGRPCCPTCSG